MTRLGAVERPRLLPREQPSGPNRTLAWLRLALAGPLPVPARLASHALIVLVTLAVALAAAATQSSSRPQVDPAWVQVGPLRVQGLDADSLYLRKAPILTSAQPSPSAVAVAAMTASEIADLRALRRRPVDNSPITVPEPHITVPERREPATYQVQPGDNLHQVAARFGVTVDSIIWSNGLDDPNVVAVGQPLVIPPVSGILHTVRPGDTVNGVAAIYGVEPAAILGWAENSLRDANAISIGQRLMVPGGKAPELVRPAPSARGGTRPPNGEDSSASRATTARLAWPTYGPITTYFGEYGHRGIDIAPAFGTPVRAAAPGRVVTAEKLQWSWGWYIVLEHEGGVRTLYGHLSRFDVGVGDRAERGQTIGAVGNTGRSTGPHLHLEVIVGGVLVDPMRYLP